MLSVDEIRRLIDEAGREPVERDTLYHRVVREGVGLADRPSRWPPASTLSRDTSHPKPTDLPSVASLRTCAAQCVKESLGGELRISIAVSAFLNVGRTSRR